MLRITITAEETDENLLKFADFIQRGINVNPHVEADQVAFNYEMIPS